MLNKYPLWKYLIIGFILVIGVYYSLPNLYPNDPAVQIRATKAGVIVNNKARISKAVLGAGLRRPWLGNDLVSFNRQCVRRPRLGIIPSCTFHVCVRQHHHPAPKVKLWGGQRRGHTRR